MCADLLSTQPYKGTRDFFPADMRLRNWFFGKIRDVLEKNSFEEYSGPMLEPIDIYAAKSGTELVCDQTYHFADRGGRQVAIRPEMTPTAARMVASRIGELTFPLRWYSVQNFYRYERPQRGRLREFWQVNADIFGCDTYEADFEIISAAVKLIRSFGADETMFKVHINNRRFFNGVMTSLTGADDDSVKEILKIIDKKAKISAEEYVRELEKRGLDGDAVKRIDAIYSLTAKEAFERYAELDGTSELKELFLALEKSGLDKYCVFDFGVVRGLDYYTGTVFEVFDEAPENNRAMFGGGRYDNLTGFFARNAKISGVGFGLGDVTLENFLKTHDLVPGKFGGEIKMFVARFGDVDFTEYEKLAEEIRAAGIPALCFLGTKKIGKQIEYALNSGCTHAVIMGADEFKEKRVKIKDFGTREEIFVPRDNLDSHLREKYSKNIYGGKS